jgi:DEAD/DEAH box helicase domain-containing protein
LFQRQAELLRLARALLAQCDCRAGCPACVGPVLAQAEVDSKADTPKALAARVLQCFETSAT